MYCPHWYCCLPAQSASNDTGRLDAPVYFWLFLPPVFCKFPQVVVLRRWETPARIRCLVSRNSRANIRAPDIQGPVAQFVVISKFCFETNRRNIGDTHIFRTVADKTVWAQPDAYEAYVRSGPTRGCSLNLSRIVGTKPWRQGTRVLPLRTCGDTSNSIFTRTTIRTYSDPRYQPYSTVSSGFRQHALLNLVRMHYLRQEHVAARKVGANLSSSLVVVDSL